MANENGRVPAWAWRLIAVAAIAVLASAGGWWVRSAEARDASHGGRIAELEKHQAVMDERLSHIRATTDATAAQVQAMYELFRESGLLKAPANDGH